MGVVLIVCGSALGALAAVGWVVGIAESAPNIDQLKARNPGQVSEVLTASGQPLGFLRSPVLRTVVPGAQIPKALKEATVAIEDRRFYHHGGVDYYAILRAGVRDLFGGGGNIQGGSTLTMELVRNTFEPRRYTRVHDLKYKIIEAKLAEQLEKVHKKNWILIQYLNDVPYGTVGGQTAYGVEAASEMFFAKPVSKLDLAQSALLAGLPQAPSSLNPFLYPNRARARRQEVLQSMVTSRYITQAQADGAAAGPLETRRNTYYTQRQEPYVLDYVQQVLEQKLGTKAVAQGGLKIYTTINPQYQQQARAAILNELNQSGDPAASVVTVNPVNGNILAMANSTSYSQSNFDYATQAQRQTGSAFKLFVLMTMIHDYNGDPNTTYYESRHLAAGWLPGNPTYDVSTAEHSYLGRINVTKATVLSDNTVFAQLDADVGPREVADMAHKMGITSPLDGYPAEGIGGLRVGVSALQMADAYATVANGGYHIPPTVISKVVYPDGKSVDLGNPQRTQVFSDGQAYAATQVLKGVITSGTGVSANYGCPAAGKTGTTTNFTDAWFVGYTPKLSTAVWVGYPNATTSMNNVNGLGAGFGGTLAAPIWKTYMQQAARGYCGDFTPPTTPFQGTPFYGYYNHFALGGPSSLLPGATTGTPSVTVTAPGLTTPTPGITTPRQYTNPQLYNPPPQTVPGAGNGTSRSLPPTGVGNGRSPSGGATG